MAIDQATPTLAYITSCKGRLSHLRESLPRIVEQPALEPIVVDYGCPEACGDWVEANFPSVKVVRSGPTSGFNASIARNLGAAAASSPWFGFFDADVLLSTSFSTRVVPALAAGNFYRANPVTYQTWGSLICHRNDFALVGGYDEAYTGWGGEDDDLITFLSLLGRRQMGFPAELLSEIAHSDEQRTRFCEIQDRWLQSRINQVYLQAKLDLYRIRGTRLESGEANALFGEIQRTFANAGGKGAAQDSVSVVLPAALIGSPPQNGMIEIAELQRTITYTVRVKGRVANPGIAPSDVECI
ncbi:MAG: glycosyltransferase family 2 protein [Rhodocyclaceae bacterium]|nr:glycosyltransferase family 2 protein [Rhodocyclaceae bacterium]